MNRKAFTLVELLIVIAIIGILAVAFGPSLFDGPAKARDAQRIEDLRKIANFINLEYIVPGKSLPATGCVTAASGLGTAINANLADFGGKFPQDPDSSFCSGYYYFVKYTSTAQKYSGMLWAKVEITENGNYPPLPDFTAFLLGNGTLNESGMYYLLPISKN